MILPAADIVDLVNSTAITLMDRSNALARSPADLKLIEVISEALCEDVALFGGPGL